MTRRADILIAGSRQVIVALDFDSAAQAFALVDRLGTAACSYKVGLSKVP